MSQVKSHSDVVGAARAARLREGRYVPLVRTQDGRVLHADELLKSGRSLARFHPETRDRLPTFRTEAEAISYARGLDFEGSGAATGADGDMLAQMQTQQDDRTDTGQGRWSHAASQVTRGVADVVASVPENIAVAQAAAASRFVDELDRIDAGKRPKSSGRNRHRKIDKYYRAKPGSETRKQIRAEFEARQQNAADMALYQWAQDTRSRTAEKNPLNPTYEGDFWTHDVPRVVGEGMATTLASLITTPVGGAFVGGSHEAMKAYRDALANGASEEEARRAANLNFASGMIGAVPVAKGAKAVIGTAGGKLADVAIDAVEGAAKGAGQTLYGNYVASDLVGFDPNRPASQGLVPSMVGGGVVGAGTGLLSGGGSSVRSGAAKQSGKAIGQAGASSVAQTRQRALDLYHVFQHVDRAPLSQRIETFNRAREAFVARYPEAADEFPKSYSAQDVQDVMKFGRFWFPDEPQVAPALASQAGASQPGAASRSATQPGTTPSPAPAAQGPLVPPRAAVEPQGANTDTTAMPTGQDLQKTIEAQLIGQLVENHRPGRGQAAAGTGRDGGHALGPQDTAAGLALEAGIAAVPLFGAAATAIDGDDGDQMPAPPPANGESGMGVGASGSIDIPELDAAAALQRGGVAIKAEAISRPINLIRERLTAEGFPADRYPALNNVMTYLDVLEGRDFGPEQAVGLARVLEIARSSPDQEERRIAGVADDILGSAVLNVGETDLIAYAGPANGAAGFQDDWGHVPGAYAHSHTEPPDEHW